ncbi:MAG TPA: sulfatase-like hydrolase/transferase [Ferruginibacter sp.]|nr:sulfatase-like hydrolase/transferase [Ferruginibacter sp.]
MPVKFRFVLRYWLSWILIFEIARIIFLLYNFREVKQHDFFTILKSLLYGLRMDASMASYITIPVCLFCMAGIFIRYFNMSGIYKIYTAIILFPVLLIIYCDLPAFNAWGQRLDAAPLKYLSSPKEAWASVSNLPVFWIFLFLLLNYFVAYRFFARMIEEKFEVYQKQQHRVLQLVILILFSAALIIPLRGGFQLAPLNQSSVYYSNDNFANLSAINVTWNFMHSISHHTSSSENPFAYLDKNESRSLKDSLLIQQGTTEKLIDLTATPNPNIILVVWESFTEKAIHTTKDGIEVTPGFNQLTKEGIYFPDIYATGDRTDKGIVGILSGYPAQPTTSIIKIPQKANKLPNLVKLFADKGFHTSFYYGGELEFANMKAYLLGSGFEKFTSKADFESRDQNSKWGAHDHIVKNKLLQELPTMKQPFFTTWLTLSSHEPYETPVPSVIKGKDDESLFLNSIHYTDSTIFELVNQCKKQPWWNNTILIIIADHGHRLPRTGSRVDDFKIPMLWLGGAIKKQPGEIAITGSQVDLPATLLAQYGFAQNPFPWSKNLLGNPLKQWAYFSFNNGFGYVEPGSYFIFDNVGKRMIEQKGPVPETMIRKGKAMQQESFGDYLLK